MRNPLLADEGLPAFDLVGPDDAEPALRERLEEQAEYSGEDFGFKVPCRWK